MPDRELRRPASEPPPPDWPEASTRNCRVPFATAAVQNPCAGRGNQTGRTEPLARRGPGGEVATPSADAARNAGRRFRRTVRLRPSWPADGVRIAPFDHNGLALYFWNGGTKGSPCSTTNSPAPSGPPIGRRVPRITSSPNPRARRYRQRPLRHSARGGSRRDPAPGGSLVLSRGDLRLLTAPLASPPDELLFDGRASFRVSLDVSRGTDSRRSPASHDAAVGRRSSRRSRVEAPERRRSTPVRDRAGPRCAERDAEAGVA